MDNLQKKVQSQLRISVVVPTYNRANDVKDVLECLLKQNTRGEFEYEIIVIDNNSKDHTRQVLETYAARYPQCVIHLYEPRQGKPYALNLGIKSTKGDIISFVDDDCLMSETYLWNVFRVFEQYGPDIG